MRVKNPRRVPCQYSCTVTTTLAVIGGKWKPLILYYLLDGTKRFNELRRMVPDITQRMLTLQLRELEEDKVVLRVVYAQVPPKVEYSLTEFGRTLQPLLTELQAWGKLYHQEHGLLQHHADETIAVE